MKAGFAKVDITPRLGVELSGFGPHLHRCAREIRDRLHARAWPARCSRTGTGACRSSSVAWLSSRAGSPGEGHFSLHLRLPRGSDPVQAQYDVT